MGLDRFQQAQVVYYLAEYRRNTFSIGAPNDAVRQVSGYEPEEFGAIVRRYLAQRPEARHTPGNWLKVMGSSLRLLATPGLNTKKLNRSWSPAIRSTFALELPLWRMTHDPAATEMLSGMNPLLMEVE